MRIDFVSELQGSDKPPTFWSIHGPTEYGFWANVNPAVPHPRWSQATERQMIDDVYNDGYIDTTIYNGYGAQVAHMYEGLEGEALWM